MKSTSCFAIFACAVLSLSFGVTQAAPIFEYSWPASGLSPEIVDLSSAGNNSNPGSATLSSTVPAGAPAGAQSLDTHFGGALTQATALLNNADVAAASGFRFDTQFLWDGTNDDGSTVLVQKIIDYAGTESLQLEDIDLSGGTATLRFLFNDGGIGPNTTIVANQWYDVSAVFAATGGVQGDGSVLGNATLTVNGNSFSESLSKTDFGDSLARPISVGAFSAAPSVVELHGFIYNPSVQLIPEPGTLVLGLLGLVSLIGRRGLRTKS